MLLDGMFLESQIKGKEYLLKLDIDRLLAPCYEAASQTPKKARYGGWESIPRSMMCKHGSNHQKVLL